MALKICLLAMIMCPLLAANFAQDDVDENTECLNSIDYLNLVYWSELQNIDVDVDALLGAVDQSLNVVLEKHPREMELVDICLTISASSRLFDVGSGMVVGASAGAIGGAIFGLMSSGHPGVAAIGGAAGGVMGTLAGAFMGAMTPSPTAPRMGENTVLGEGTVLGIPAGIYGGMMGFLSGVAGESIIIGPISDLFIGTLSSSALGGVAGGALGTAWSEGVAFFATSRLELHYEVDIPTYSSRSIKGSCLIFLKYFFDESGLGYEIDSCRHRYLFPQREDGVLRVAHNGAGIVDKIQGQGKVVVFDRIPLF